MGGKSVQEILLVEQGSFKKFMKYVISFKK